MRSDLGAARTVTYPVDQPSWSFANGATFGINAGYDLQFGRFVAGPLLGMDFSGSRQSGNTPYFGARLGILATDRLLIFAMAGAQSTQHAVDASAMLSVGLNNAWPSFAILQHVMAAKAGRRWGAFVGAGAEFRVTSNWALTADYSYLETNGRYETTVNNIYFPNYPVGLRTNVSSHTFRIGLKYRLGGELAPTAMSDHTPSGTFGWTGAWIGLAAGLRTDTGFTLPAETGPADWPYRYRSRAVTGTLGGNAGYDLQIGRLVTGAMARIDFAGAGLAGNMPYFGLRAGVLADDRVLVYLAAGVQSMQATPRDGSWWWSGPLWSAELRERTAKVGRQWGAFFGGGLEYRMTANWSVSADYSYARTNSRFRDEPTFFPPSPRWRADRPAELSTHTFRLGLKYRL
ncbi:OmpA-like transmembrane domain protein [bacterium YEK0313]|nr:OmpA-like transmembrane domain protein [bacterium YEK0313]